MASIGNRPVQMIFSFEGFINGATAGEEVHVSWRPESYDLSNFEQRVRTELGKLKDLGVGCVVANVGYDNYLENEEAWQRFVTGLRCAVELGLRIWIYDENGYPSGTAGGKVLKGHPELEAMGLKRMVVPSPETSLSVSLPDPRGVLFSAHGVRPDGSRQCVATERGKSQVDVSTEDFQSVEVYFVAPLYEGTHAVSNYSSARRYINLMSSAAIKRFVTLTHQKYFEKIPADLHKHIEAFFTDEPSLMAQAFDNTPMLTSLIEDSVNPDLPLFASVPWCDEMEAKFLDDHGYALAEHVPDLFSGTGDRTRKVRRDFWRSAARLYEAAYGQQMAEACAALGVDCAGHFLGEDSLLQQVVLHVDLIQNLKHFHRPGLDLLSGSVTRFANHILTHKTASSASFFGGRGPVMSETSDFIESLGSKEQTLSTAEIQCVLALQYLMGVRDFVLLFQLSRLTPEAYGAINELVALLVETGGDRGFLPEAALYFPIDLAWERYCPVCPLSDLGGAGIEGRVLDVDSEELKNLCRLTTETIKRLFYSNVQYVLCERPDIGLLADRRIKELVYYGPDRPDAELASLCREARVDLVELGDYEAAHRGNGDCRAGSKVVYATYDGFVFAVNYGTEPSSMAVAGAAEAVFPMEGPERTSVSGPVVLAPYQCVFLFPPS